MFGGASTWQSVVRSKLIPIFVSFGLLSACDQDLPYPTVFDASGKLSGEAVFEEGKTRTGDLTVSILGNEYSTEAWMLSLAFLRMAEIVRENGQEYFVIVALQSEGAISAEPTETDGAICQEDGYLQLPGANLVARPLNSMSDAPEYVSVVSVDKVFNEIAPLAYGQDVEKMRWLIEASSYPCPDIFGGGGKRFRPWEFLDVLSQPSVEQMQSENNRIELRAETETGDFKVSGDFPSFTSAARATRLAALKVSMEVVRRGGDQFWIKDSRIVIGCQLALTRPEVSLDVGIVRDEMQIETGVPAYSAVRIIASVEQMAVQNAVSLEDRLVMRSQNVEFCEGGDELQGFGKVVDLNSQLALFLDGIGGVKVAP